MRTKLSILAAAVAALATIAAAPASSGELCYDLDVNVQGQEVINEQGCQELPEVPELP